MKRYRTIVADPPWAYDDGFALGPGHGKLVQRALPYNAMALPDICALPIAEFAASDCRLFLWTTNRYMCSAFEVVAEWGFEYKQTLVWHKRDANLPGSVAPNSAEFILVGVKGTPPPWPNDAVCCVQHDSPGRTLCEAGGLSRHG